MTGSTYRFTVESRNVFGYSSPTSELEIYCGFIPEKVVDVLTTVSGPNVVFSW